MTHKKYRLFVVMMIAVFIATAAGCGGAAAPAAAPTQAPAVKKVLKVGLLTTGPVHDQGWNQLGYDSLMKIKDTLGAETSYVESLESPATYEKAFTDYASQGYDIVIAHGFEFVDAAEVVSKKYPKTIFLTSGGTKFGPNFAGVNFHEEQVNYLMGLIAGNLTKSHKAIAIGGHENPSITLPLNGFKAGFEAVKGNTYTVTYLNSWTDINAGKEAALAGFAAGADIIVVNADLAGQGSIQAAIEKNILTFGSNYDQTSLAPNNIVASTVLEYPQAYLDIAQAVQDGTIKINEAIWIGLDHEKAIYLAYNPALADKITPDIKAQVEDARKKIISGELKVPFAY